MVSSKSFYLLLLAGISHALPPYIRPCVRGPDFNKCALKNGRLAIPELVKGDRKFNVPVMDPLEISEVKVTQGPKQAGFTLQMKDVKMHGLKDASLEDTRYDFDKRHVTQVLRMPVLTIVGKYDISGRLLVLPINGNGDINITMVECKVTFNHGFDLKEVDGKNYLIITDPVAEVEPSRVYMKLTNLFGGDKLLGKQMNEFMNENWRDVFKELSPTLAQAFAEVTASLINGIAKSIPYEEIFPLS